jgi:outer membrane biosynthesis protein TonB
VAALRDDDAELARLQRETTTLKAQLDNAAAAKRAKEELARSAAAASPTLELSQLDQVPRPTFQKAPVFPAELRKAGVQVAVVVSFVVDSTGSVQNLILTQIKRLPQADGKELDPAVLKSLPMGDFSTAALEAVSQWKFDPGVKGGRMVNTRMQVPIVFNAGPQDVQTGTPTPQEAGSNDIKKTGGWF